MEENVETLESLANPGSAVVPGRVHIDPDVVQLHQARKNGDLHTVKRLEAAMWKPNFEGDAASEIIRRPSTTVGRPGDLDSFMGQPSAPLGGSKMERSSFGADRHVRSSNPTSKEWNQAAVTDSNGNIYVAWQDDLMAHDYIQIYRSQDGGASWTAFGNLHDKGVDLKEPSLAIGEGYADTLLVAYIVDDGVTRPVPEVATSPLDTANFTFHPIPVWKWDGYAKPVIWTDTLDFSKWRGYLTCEGIFDAPSNDINVCAWRSQNQGNTWDSGIVLAGNGNTQAWIDPDGTYGTTLEMIHIAFYNDSDNTLYVSESSDFGTSYTAPAALHTLSTDPIHPVDPEIASAVNHDNIMICCTIQPGTNENIGYTNSQNAGSTWGSLWSISGGTSNHEFAPALHANQGGQSWHLAFTSNHHVYHSHKPQDLSWFWQTDPDPVDDTHYASHDYTKKGITSNRDTNVCGIAWADYRDGPGDYDTYFDYVGNSMDYHVPGEYATIQEAIDAAPAGGTVLVARGSYSENIDFHGKEVLVISEDGAHSTFIVGDGTASVVTFANGEGVDAKLQGFTITNGNAWAGGAVYCDGSTPYVTNRVLTLNQAVNGGAIYCDGAAANIVHCTVVNNTATAAGGGLYMTNGSDGQLKNSNFWDDNAPSSPEIYVENSSPEFKYCNVEGGWPGNGMKDADPQFLSPSNWDFHIPATSPCRNAAAYFIGGLPMIDYEGDYRFGEGFPDIGADEYHLHLYYRGEAMPGNTIFPTVIGDPAATQVGVWVSFNALDTPVNGAYGEWWLLPPLVGPFLLGAMPASGVISIPAPIPPSIPGPYVFYLQALVGPPYALTNLCPVYVE